MTLQSLPLGGHETGEPYYDCNILAQLRLKLDSFIIHRAAKVCDINTGSL
jgi:hypothetical protein